LRRSGFETIARAGTAGDLCRHDSRKDVLVNEHVTSILRRRPSFELGGRRLFVFRALIARAKVAIRNISPISHGISVRQLLTNVRLPFNVFLPHGKREAYDPIFRLRLTQFQDEAGQRHPQSPVEIYRSSTATPQDEPSRNTIMSNLFKRFAADESGATAIEYGLIASLIAVAIITVLTTLGGNLTNTLSKVATNLKAS
jgi:pilus assembly protein Flp/PilA